MPFGTGTLYQEGRKGKAYVLRGIEAEIKATDIEVYVDALWKQHAIIKSMDALDFSIDAKAACDAQVRMAIVKAREESGLPMPWEDKGK